MKGVETQTAIAAAATAFPTWSRLVAKERSKVMRRRAMCSRLACDAPGAAVHMSGRRLLSARMPTVGDICHRHWGGAILPGRHMCHVQACSSPLARLSDMQRLCCSACAAASGLRGHKPVLDWCQRRRSLHDSAVSLICTESNHSALVVSAWKVLQATLAAHTRLQKQAACSCCQALPRACLHP